MAITVKQQSAVQNANGIGAGGTIAASLTGVTAGNMLVLLVAWEDDGNQFNHPATVADGTNTWNNSTTGGDVNGNLNNSMGALIYSSYNIASGSPTVTLTSNGTTTAGNVDASIILLEIAGAATAAAFDSGGTATATGNGTTGPVTGTGGTLANAGDIVFALSSAAGFKSGLTTPASWTNLGLSSAVFPTYSFAYILPGATTALSPSFGSYGSSAFWAFAMGAYQPAAAATSPPIGQALIG